jgi:hypothetical protein
VLLASRGDQVSFNTTEGGGGLFRTSFEDDVLNSVIAVKYISLID